MLGLPDVRHDIVAVTPQRSTRRTAISSQRLSQLRNLDAPIRRQRNRMRVIHLQRRDVREHALQSRASPPVNPAKISLTRLARSDPGLTCQADQYSTLCDIPHAFGDGMGGQSGV
jgi:hypothetical protein